MKFGVRTLTSSFQRCENRIGSFIVSDQPESWLSETPWPVAAEFKVSMRFDEETQRRRAWEYADYLNGGINIQPPIGSTEQSK